MVCGGESLSLGCSEPEDHIAIFSSSFKSAGAGPLYCPLRQEYIREALDYSKDEAGRDMKKCERADMTKSLIKHCHGKKTCSITADPEVLGASACHLQHVLLKTTYACMTGDNFLPDYVKQFDNKQEAFTDKIFVTSDSEAFITKERTSKNPLDRKDEVIVSKETSSESSIDILDNKGVDTEEDSMKDKNNDSKDHYSEIDTEDTLLNTISSGLILNFHTIKVGYVHCNTILTLLIYCRRMVGR